MEPAMSAMKLTARPKTSGRILPRFDSLDVSTPLQHSLRIHKIGPKHFRCCAHYALVNHVRVLSGHLHTSRLLHLRVGFSKIVDRAVDLAESIKRLGI